MKPKLVFVLDVPGWSIDNFIHRVGQHLKRFNLVKHYVFSSPDDARFGLHGGKANFDDISEGDVYYFGSWWWFWEWVRRGGRPLKNVVVDVVDDYSWVWNPVQWDVVESRVDMVLTQSLPFLHGHPGAVFHPFPAGVRWFEDPLRHEVDARDRTLKVGMIASSFTHEGSDHKGVGIGRAVCRSVPGVELTIAGVDVNYSFQELIEFYRGLDVFMCLSRSEGFSSSTVNAAALGVPIISTPVSPAEPFIPESGFMFVPDRRCGDTEVLESVRFWIERFKSERLTVFDAVCDTRCVAERWRSDKVANFIETVISGLL